MKEIDLILIRHGKTEWNQANLMQGFGNSPLLPASIKEIKKIHINYTKKAVIFTSDQGRAMSTARYVANKYPAVIMPDARLRERNFGILEGHSTRNEPDFMPYRETILTRYEREELAVPGAEQIDSLVARMTSWLDVVKSNYSENTVIVVGHGEWIRIFLNLIEGRDPWVKGIGIIPNATPIYKKISV